MIRVEGRKNGLGQADEDFVTLAMADPELGPDSEIDSLTMTVEYVPDAGRVILEIAPGAGATLELVVRTLP